MKNELKIKYLKPGELVEYKNNSKTHPKKQIDKLINSIKQFGFLSPVLINGAIIVAGHARVMAAIKMGLDAIPTIDASHLTEQQIRAYCIADNKISEMGEWDEAILNSEIDLLLDDGFDLGFLDIANQNNEADNLENQEVNFNPKLQVLVDCENEYEQQAAYDKITELGFKCKILSM